MRKTGRVAFMNKTNFAGKSQGGLVTRLDVGFKPMQAQVIESVAKDKRKPF